MGARRSSPQRLLPCAVTETRIVCASSPNVNPRQQCQPDVINRAVTGVTGVTGMQEHARDNIKIQLIRRLRAVWCCAACVMFGAG